MLVGWVDTSSHKVATNSRLSSSQEKGEGRFAVFAIKTTVTEPSLAHSQFKSHTPLSSPAHVYVYAVYTLFIYSSPTHLKLLVTSGSYVVSTLPTTLSFSDRLWRNVDCCAFSGEQEASSLQFVLFLITLASVWIGVPCTSGSGSCSLLWDVLHFLSCTQKYQRTLLQCKVHCTGTSCSPSQYRTIQWTNNNEKLSD